MVTRFRDGQWVSYPRAELNQVPIHRGLAVSERAMWLWAGRATRFNGNRDVAYFSHPDSLLVGPVGPGWIHVVSAHQQRRCVF